MDIFEKLLYDRGPLGKHADVEKGYFFFPKLEGQIAPRMTFRGKEVLTWSLNNYLGLANDPEVRANSIHPEQIDIKKHQAWFAERLDDSKSLFLVAVDDLGNRMGQVRFNPDKENMIISISLHRLYRGKGLAGSMVHYACKKLIDERLFTGSIVAYVVPENIASIRIFENNNFVLEGDTILSGRIYNIYLKQPN